MHKVKNSIYEILLSLNSIYIKLLVQDETSLTSDDDATDTKASETMLSKMTIAKFFRHFR